MSSRKLPALVAEFVSMPVPQLTAPIPSQADPVESAPVLPAGIAEQLGDAAFARARWREAWLHYQAALRSNEAVVDISKCLLFGARAALYLGEHMAAQRLLAAYADAFPADAEGLFYLGKSLQAAHRDFDALNAFNAASLIQSNRPKYLAAVAQAAHSIAFGGYGFAADASQATYIAIARSALAAALAKDADHLESLTESMLIALDSGEIDRAMEFCQRVIEKEKKHGPEKVAAVTSSLALALARGGHSDRIPTMTYLESYAAGRRILARAKVFAPIGENPATAPAQPASLLAPAPYGRGWSVEAVGGGLFGWAKQRVGAQHPAESVSIDCEFVAPMRDASRAEIGRMVERLRGLPAHFAGAVSFRADTMPGSRSADAVRVLLIRKSAWNELVVEQPEADWAQIVDTALQQLRLHVASNGAALASSWRNDVELTPPVQRVVVLSRHGPSMVGGGEQFLKIAGQTYAKMHGASVFFAGLTTDWSEAETAWPDGGPGFVAGFVHDDAGSFRSFVLRNRVDVVHVISGLGEFALDACRGLNVRLIYGVHFWREFIPSRVLSRPYYPNVGMADAKPLAAMQEIIARADFTYVNSDLCSDMAVKAYQWSPPVIYSVPVAEAADAAREPTPAEWPKDFVLLANARADKGWHLFLDIAARLPNINFVAIAGQSDQTAALVDVQRRGLYNVKVLDRTDQMDRLYRAAAVVVVPSFSFVETFSRVVIEAGRFGRPVLMADSGNLSYLGRDTDLVLANDAAVWADRIARLYSNPRSYKHAASQALKIARTHTAESLLARLGRIPIAGNTPRILVCAGSGVGNICHVSPLVRHLSDAYATTIDVLVAGDFEGSSAAMAGSPFVGQVFESFAHVEQRPYDIVLVTHSFGSVVPAFNAYRVLASRDFGQFDPAGSMHEAVFNLEFAKRALGLDYEDADARDYFFGGITREPEGKRKKGPTRIALHAGSKGGIWASKRWPGFAELAGALIAGGAEVISVGVKSEYVEGTIDKTDLTIARMAEEISGCDALVSNDSGVMNIGNALGVPMVALFGPTNPVTRGPIKSAVRILAPATACSPCEAKPDYKQRFDSGKCQCISLISTMKVLAALEEVWADRDSATDGETGGRDELRNIA